MSILSQLSVDQLENLDQGGETWQNYRQACYESLYFFLKAVWITIPSNRNLMSRSCHEPLCLTLEAVNRGEIKRLLVEDPRRHLKSTIVTKGRPVHKLVKRAVMGEDPSDRFAFYSSTMTNSQRQWREIRWGFESNKLFQFLFPELIPDFLNLKFWNESEGTIPRLWNPQEPTFDCLGGGKATSRHYDDITEDDLINEENYDSPSAVQKSLEYHRQAENLLEDTKGVIVVVGNRWGMADLNHSIHMEEPETAIFTRSVYGPLLDGKYKCRLLPPAVMALLAKMPEGEPIWPERFDREELGRILMKEKPRIFTAQYLNNPADPDAVDFRLEWIKECQVVWLPAGQGQDPIPHLKYSDDPKPIPFSALNLYLTWDPALDGKDSASRNALVVTSIDYLGRIAVIKDYARKEDPLQSLQAFISIAKQYAGYLKASGMEEVLFQKVLGRMLPEEAASQQVFLGLRKLKTPSHQAKDQRIRAWVGTLFADGKVYVRQGCGQFIEEYSHFGIKDAKRDLMDAFAYATQLWSKPLSPDELAQQDAQEEELTHDLGVTGYGSTLLVPGKDRSQSSNSPGVWL